MNDLKAFKYFYGMNLHFKNEKFSILKYGFDMKKLSDKFNTLTTNQKFQFAWLGNKFPTTENMVFACMGCLFDSIDMQFGNREEILLSYFRFKSRREGLAYVIKSDHEKREYDEQAVNFEGLLYKYLAQEYCPEYVIVNDPDLIQLKKFYADRNFGFCRDRILYLIKYSQFFNPEKYHHIVKEHEHAI